MNQILLNLMTGAKNLHVSVPMAIAIGFGIAGIWLPDKLQPKLRATEVLLVSYGVMSAANSGPSNEKKP